MFRNFLSTKSNFIQLSIEWIKKLDGLIRVVVFDSENSKGYVTVYYEQKNKYAAVAFDLKTGTIHWTKEIANGGYGAPAITNDALILPTKFSNIVALSKEDGKELWHIETNCRVRSPLNVCNENIYFSSGGTIFELDSKGTILKKWYHDAAFFYGSIDVCNELVLSLGTITDESGDSVIQVFAFHRKGGLAYSLPISKSPIVSADTAAIALKEGIAFIGGSNVIMSFQVSNGKILWISQVDGFAGRQVCTIDDLHVYYSTLSGNVGALNIENGTHVWSIKTKDMYIGAPMSKLDSHLLLLADAHLIILKSHNGQLVQKLPVGHSPYSMVSLKGEYAFLGAGEPPHNGLLFAFRLSDNLCQKNKYECFAQLSNAFIESTFADVIVTIPDADSHLISVALDGSIFYLSDPIIGEKVTDTNFTFRVPIPKTLNSGDFVIPIYLASKSGEILIRPVYLFFDRKDVLPSRGYLTHISDIIQEDPLYSGAAIGSAMKELHGDYVEQSSLREMIDFVRDRSGYEPFQTWRILLRRVLTSSASNKNELPEFQSTDRVQ